MSWRKVERWDVGEVLAEVPSPELLIVEDETGRRVLLARMKPNVVEVAQWRYAVQLLPDDNRQRLERETFCGVPAWRAAIEGRDVLRPVLEWDAAAVHRIAESA
jgi:hypothetical protein